MLQVRSPRDETTRPHHCCRHPACACHGTSGCMVRGRTRFLRPQQGTAQFFIEMIDVITVNHARQHTEVETFTSYQAIMIFLGFRATWYDYSRLERSDRASDVRDSRRQRQLDLLYTSHRPAHCDDDKRWQRWWRQTQARRRRMSVWETGGGSAANQHSRRD